MLRVFSMLQSVAIVLTAGAALTSFAGRAEAITSQDFTYSKKQVGHYAIDPLALAPYAEDLTYKNAYFGDLTITDGKAGCFGTGINLPQSARVTKFTVVSSSSSNYEPNFGLARHDPKTGGTEFVANSKLEDDTEKRTLKRVKSNPDFSIIDNEHYSYSLLVCIGKDDHFFGANIRYIFTSAGD